MKKLTPVFIALVLLLGCDSSSDSGNGGTSPLGAEAYFPLQIGNWWKYNGWELDALGNTIPGTDYLLYTKVIDDTVISGQAYYILQDSSNASGLWQSEIAQLARISGDSIIFLMSFFEDTVNLQTAVMGILPASVGDEWNVLSIDTTTSSPGGDTVGISLVWTGTILAYGSMNVPAGDFSDCYHLGYTMDLEVSTPDTAITFFMESKSWSAPHVGIAKMTQFPWDGPDGPEPGDYQELVEYSVALP